MRNRIQRKRSRGWKFPENAIYVGRARGPYGRFGNQFIISLNGGRAEAVRRHWDWLLSKDVAALVYVLGPLRGKDLACWCKLSELCHADNYLAVIELLERRGLFDSKSTELGSLFIKSRTFDSRYGAQIGEREIYLDRKEISN